MTWFLLPASRLTMAIPLRDLGMDICTCFWRFLVLKCYFRKQEFIKQVILYGVQLFSGWQVRFSRVSSRRFWRTDFLFCVFHTRHFWKPGLFRHLASKWLFCAHFSFNDFLRIARVALLLRLGIRTLWNDNDCTNVTRFSTLRCIPVYSRKKALSTWRLYLLLLLTTISPCPRNGRNKHIMEGLPKMPQGNEMLQSKLRRDESDPMKEPTA